MHEEMLTYGLNKETGELVNIDSDDIANGLKCDCVCPYCKHDLIAKNRPDNKKRRHFAHAPGSEDCGKGRMTALHMLAQNILARNKKVLLPAYDTRYISKKALPKTFQKVELEQV